MLTPVTSSNLHSVGYSKTQNSLVVKFKSSGRIYAYENVPLAVYQDLMNANSKGIFFDSEIKGSYVTKEIHESEVHLWAEDLSSNKAKPKKSPSLMRVPFKGFAGCAAYF